MDRFLDDAPEQKKSKAKEIQAELNSNRERIHVLMEGKVRWWPYCKVP